VLIGGTMGTCSYVLTGTEQGMSETFGSTCHGAGRALSRAKSRRNLEYTDVLKALEAKGISIRVASPKLVMEEAPESYKNVTDVVDTCHEAGISQKCIKLRPIAVIKGYHRFSRLLFLRSMTLICLHRLLWSTNYASRFEWFWVWSYFNVHSLCIACVEAFQASNTFSCENIDTSELIYITYSLSEY